MSSSVRKTLWPIFALMPVPVLWCLLFEFGALDRAREWSVDVRFRYRGEMSAPAQIVYIDIDSISLSPARGKGIGGWPWSRDYFETVARGMIEHGGAKAVGIDVLMSDVGVAEAIDRDKLIQGNRTLMRYLFKDPPVVLAGAFAAEDFRDVNQRRFKRTFPELVTETRPREEIEGPEVPSFLVGALEPMTPAGVGFIDDPWQGRKVGLWAPSNVRTYYSLAVELLRRYWDLPLGEDNGIRVEPDALSFVRENGDVVCRVPLFDRQMMEVNWFSPWISDKNVRRPFIDAYLATLFVESDDPARQAEGAAFFANPAFKNSIVLIGPTDPLLQDLAPTPFDETPVPKVGVHGNILKTILSGRYLHRLAKWQIFAVVFLLSALTAGLAVWSRKGANWPRVLAAGLVVAYIGAALVLFAHYDWVLPLISPVGSALSTTFAAVAWQAVREQKAKGRIKGMFGTYLAPTVVASMIESGKDPELGGHDAEITAYFSDIQSFSSFSEVLTSSQLGELLNEYLTVCTDIIQAEGGTLDKYIGDAVVAMFGAPVDLESHAYKACLVSQLVQVKLGELRTKWKTEGEKWPPMVSEMRTRIGLNTGVCMIGNMGSRTRFNYTMMGDNVNLAARMESGAKSWGAFTMVTQTTRDACEKYGGDRLVFRSLGRIVVKGRSQPVPIHEIVGLREHLSAEALDCVAVFERGLERYYARDWIGASDLFVQSEALETWRPGRDPGVKSNPSLVYQGIVAEMADHPPPAQWDGVYHMTEK